MAILRMSDVNKMDAKNRKQKLSELQVELTKANNKGSPSRGKRKELKRAVARLHTFNNSAEGGSKKK